SAEGILFNKDKTQLIGYPAGNGRTSYIIPNSVTRISREAFYFCDALTSVTIPNSVTYIGSEAFRNCYALTSVTIPNSVTYIGGDAFRNCYALTSVTIPNGVTYIGGGAFCGCETLTSVTIPNSVTYIGGGAFDYCDSLTSITIFNSDCDIDCEFADGVEYLIIKGYKGSTAEQAAKEYGRTFVSIDTYNDYYAAVGDVAIVTRKKNGTTLMGCTITVGDKKYTAEGHTTHIEIPDGYSGKVTVSKAGYITSSLPATMLKEYNFFVMYPDTETAPVTQHYLLRDANSSGNGYVDLLRSSEYIYDLGNKKHDIYIDVNPNGHTVKSIYLLQGKQKVMLENGMNYDVNSNGLFNSEGGTIYLCIETSDGTVYKTNSKIVAAKTRVSLDADIQGSVSGVIDEELSAVGGMSFDGKCKLGDLPVSITMEENKVKGTIGITGSDQSTATWYEAISDTIKKHKKENGDEEYDSETIKKLEKKLKDSGADVVEGYSSFGIDVNASIIGYIEANWNPETCKLQDIQVGMILKVAGEASYTQQSTFVVVGVPIPYYWTVELGLALSTQINGKWQYGANDQIDFSVEMPELSIGAEITGSLCLGMDKIVGGGGKVNGGITVTFTAPDYSFTSSVWQLSYEIGLTGQLAGFSGDLNLKDGTYQIYPQTKANAVAGISENLMLDYVQNNKLLALSNSVKAATYNTAAANATSGHTFKSNGYTYSAPTVAKLSNGSAVMVWVDYDNQRADINKTALFYSVYNPNTGTWSTPQQVENDGTADDFPVLKTFNNKIYLVWNDADQPLTEDDDFSDMLSAMGVSYAAFNGSAFTSVTSVSGQNNYMDICPDIAMVGGKPTVVWLQNTKNDIFGLSGINNIMLATLQNGAWGKTNVIDLSAAVNSLTVVEENDSAAIYYSKDASAATDSFDDYEIFKVYNGQETQITNNEYADTGVTSEKSTVYWRGNGAVVSSDSLACDGVANQYVVLEDAYGKSTIIYAVEDADGITEYMLCKETDNGFTSPILLTSGNYSSGGFDAFWREDTLVLLSNEIGKDLSSSIKVYEFDRSPRLSIESAYYDLYTLVKGGQLYTTVTIKNNGSETANGFTLQATLGDAKQTLVESDAELLPGEEKDIMVIIDLPEKIDFTKIDFCIPSEESDAAVKAYSMPLSLQDISLENATIVGDDSSLNLSVSAVNRGVADLSDITIYLRKDSEQGEVLSSHKISQLSSRQEEIVQFDVSDQLSSVSRLYVTTDFLENEENVANNSDFAVYTEFEENEVIKESVFDQYDQIVVDESQKITVDENNTEAIYIFMPEQDGTYAFYSHDNDMDTYGYVYDSEMNELASDDDGGENNNFMVTYSMNAGEVYYLKATPYDDSDVGEFSVTITKMPAITQLEIASLPTRMDYYAGFEYFWYSGLKLKATMEDGSTVDWSYNDDDTLAGYDVNIVDYYEEDEYVETVVTCNEKSVNFQFNLKENPVDHLEVVSGTACQYIENYNGYMDENDDGEYFYYYTNYPSDTVIKIVYKDGSSITANVGDSVENYEIFWSEDQYEEPWVLGTNNKSTVSYLGHTVNLPITVKKNDVSSIEVVSGKVICIENTDGYVDENDEGEYYYYYYDMPSDVVIKINYTDGLSKSVSILDNVDGWSFNWESNQYDNPWVLGDDNHIVVSYLGYETQLPVSIIVNPAERIEINSAPTREYVYGDEEYGYLYSDGTYEFYPTDLTGLSFTVYYKDGTSKLFTHAHIDKNENIAGFGYQLHYNEYDAKIGDFPVEFEYMGLRANYTVVLKEAGHSHISDSGMVVIPATCTSTGTKIYKCTLCGEVIQADIIPQLDHDYDSGEVTKAATCKETGVKTYTCVNCGATKTETIDKSKTHTYSNSCDSSCNICGATRSTTHSYGQYVYNNDATTTKDGTKTRTCSVCGDKQTVTAEGTKIQSNPFKDVKKSDFYYTPVLWAVEKGITSGTSKTTFAPNEACTRGQIATFLWRAAGCPNPKTSKNPFTD
ncbi:MAG: leucine-rich repeat protein, partial [Clostridia bacterium]|nr:leucine-rich repeat protein [Clostridia bacterium]